MKVFVTGDSNSQPYKSATENYICYECEDNLTGNTQETE